MNKILKVILFKGRINRTEYTISMVIVVFLLYFIRELFNGNPPEYLIAIVGYFYYSQGAKRCQDRGINGFWAINPVNFIFNFSDKSEKDENVYGTPPKQIFQTS